MLKILALFAVASAEVACPAGATAENYCKNAAGYIGKCTANTAGVYALCAVKDDECAGKAAGAVCGGSGNTFGKCENAGEKCKYAPCPALAADLVSNGTLTCTEEPGSNQCTLNCDSGYTVETPTGRKCSAAGTWEGDAGSCKVLPGCANTGHPTVTNGTFDCSTVLAPGSNPCTLNCDTGYTVDTATGRKCSAAGAWEGDAGTCKMPNCVNTGHPAVTNGTLDCSAVVASGSTPCTLNCDTGYTVDTATGRKCSAAGAWEGDAGTCKMLNCVNTGHPAVTNGTLDCSAVVARGSAKCTLTCATKYKIKTATGRKCSAAGVWEGVAGACESDAAAISIAAAIVVAVFALH